MPVAVVGIRIMLVFVRQWFMPMLMTVPCAGWHKAVVAVAMVPIVVAMFMAMDHHFMRVAVHMTLAQMQVNA